MRGKIKMSRKILYKSIGQALIEYGTITESQHETALKHIKNTNNRICNSLVELGYISENRLMEAISNKLNLPRLALAGIEINPNIARLIPHDLAYRYSTIPILLMGNTLTIATDDPLDTAALEEISRLTNLRIKPVLASFTEIRRTLDKYYSPPRPKK